MLTPVLILAVIFGAIVAIIYLSIRKKERMALLQSGHDASFFNTNRQCFSSLKWGLLLFFVGIGLLFADIIAKQNLMTPEAAYFSMAFIAGGFALIIDFFIERSRAKQQANETKNEVS
jgi:hypothetical protein